MAPNITQDVLPESLKQFNFLPDGAYVRARIVARLFDCSDATVWRMARSGKLTATKLSPGITGFNVGDLRKVLAKGGK